MTGVADSDAPGPAPRVVLAIDVGSSAVKVGLVDPGGIIGGNSAVAERPISTSSPADRWVEQDADEWWRATDEAVGDLDAAGRAEVDVVAVTGQMQDLLALDGAGRPVRPVILYSDLRATAEHDDLAHELGDAWGDAIGALPDPTNRLATWRWIEEHEPRAAEQTSHLVFGGGSEIVRRVTGRIVSDHTTAATTGLYDVEQREWWEPARLRVTPSLPVLDDGAATPADPRIVADWRLAPSARVVLAPGDAVATTLGVVGSSVGRPYAHLGTSGWVAVGSDQRATAPRVIQLPGLGADHRLHVEPILSAGSLVDWARHALLGGASNDELERLVTAGFGAGAGVLVVPDLDGRRDAPDATAHVVGLTRAATTEDLAAAVLEGVAHRLRRSLELIGPAADHLVVCGGGASSDEWCQVIADVTDRRVTRTDATHASLLGAAHAAGLVVHVDHDLDRVPRPERARVHRALGGTFDALSDRLAETESALRAVR